MVWTRSKSDLHHCCSITLHHETLVQLVGFIRKNILGVKILSPLVQHNSPVHMIVETAMVGWPEADVQPITNVIIVNNFVDNTNSKYIVAMVTSHPAANMAHMRRP